MADEPTRPEPEVGETRRETRALNINIQADLHRRMGRYRADQGVTLTDQVEQAVQAWLTDRDY